MQIIDDFLPIEIYQQILTEINGLNFAWYYRNWSSYKDDMIEQFTHTFYTDGAINSHLFDLVKHLIIIFEQKTNYKIKRLHRAKANLLLNSAYKEKDLQKAIHRDIDLKNCISLLYYVENSDGDTVIFSEDKKKQINRISPKANRALIFKSHEWHNATPPKIHRTRKVINFIFEIE
jgi:hypothetical protein